MRADLHPNIIPPSKRDFSSSEIDRSQDPADPVQALALIELLEENPFGVSRGVSCLQVVEERRRLASARGIEDYDEQDLRTHFSRLQALAPVVRGNTCLEARHVQEWFSRTMALDAMLNGSSSLEPICNVAAERFKESFSTDIAATSLFALERNFFLWRAGLATSEADALTAGLRCAEGACLVKEAASLMSIMNRPEAAYAAWVSRLVIRGELARGQRATYPSGERSRLMNWYGDEFDEADEETRRIGRSVLVWELCAENRRYDRGTRLPQASDISDSLFIIDRVISSSADLHSELISAGSTETPLALGPTRDEILLSAFLAERQIWATEWEFAEATLAVLGEDIANMRSLSASGPSAQMGPLLPRWPAEDEKRLESRRCFMLALLEIGREETDFARAHNLLKEGIGKYPFGSEAGTRACLRFLSLTGRIWQEQGYEYQLTMLGELARPFEGHDASLRLLAPWTFG